MAELALCASVIAVIQVSQTVITQACRYGQTVKNAEKDIKRIESELSDVRDTLIKLQDLADRAEKSGLPLDRWPTLISMMQKGGPLSKCSLALNSLLSELAPVHGLAKLKERVLWPSKVKKVEQALGTIARQKNSFIEALNIEQVEQVQEVGCIVTDMSKSQNEEKILKWLSHTDPTVNHIVACEKHEPQTGSWFIEGEEYRTWRETPSSFLWLYGIPGCGKTILCSTIIENIRTYCASDPFSSVAYFYFSFNDTEKQNTRNFLRSILAQLAWSKPGIPGSVRKLHSSHQHGQPPTDGLKAAILSVLEPAGQTFLIVDALDECPYGEERTQLSAALTGFSAWALPNLHILVTSRRESDIEKALAPIITSPPVCIQTEQAEVDILLYVKTQLANDVNLKEWSPQIKRDIETALVGGANGMFRWVFCQVDSLKRCLNTRGIQRTLKSLPKTLDDTYDRILSSISDEYHQKAISALQWLAVSERPLRIIELAEAVVISPQADPPFDPGDRLANPRYILQVLSSLVTTSVQVPAPGEYENLRPVEVIKLAHFSVKEYLTSERMVRGPTPMFYTVSRTANQAIAKSCLLYIKSYDLAKHKLLSDEDLEEFPLMRYASKFWYVHATAEQGALEDSLSDLVVKLLISGSWLSSWLQFHHPDGPWDTFLPTQVYDPAPPLYYSSYLGFCLVAKGLIDSGADINAQGGYYGNALQAASLQGRGQIVKLLLENGADVNAQGGCYGNALQAASLQGRGQIVKLLLENGADFNAQGGYYGNALQVASFQGRDQIVKLLLESGADVNAQGGHYGNALQAASFREHDQIIKLLLENGADVNAQGGPYGSALQAASLHWRGQIVKLLLDNGADINAQGGPFGNALLVASLGGHIQTVGVLLENGADVNAQGGYYGSALQVASFQGSDQIITLLLENGADINAQGGRFGNALQAASRYGHTRTVGVLLENGADVNAQGGHYGSALQAASSHGHDQTIKLLLENGADVNAQGGYYGNALQAASLQEHDQIIKLLLECGADVNAQGGYYGSALQAASLQGRGQIVKLLLDNGADINAQGGHFGNALQVASRYGHTRTVGVLLENGADVNAQGGYYGSALQAASSQGHDQIAKLLLENGADVNVYGGYYRSALQAASSNDHTQIAELLLQKGAVPIQ